MKSTTALCRLLAVAVVATGLSGLAPVTASAQTTPQPSAAADAYALDVDVRMALNLTVNQGPFARASQDYPPAVAPADDAAVVGPLGPYPSANGEVVKTIEGLSSMAMATGTPLAVASAQASDVQLLAGGGTPLITATEITAMSTSDCVNEPSAAGTQFANLQVLGVAAPIQNPAPNTELAPLVFNPLGLRVIVNEQHPTADGRGLVVNGLHIYNLEPSPLGLFDGDVIVSHAMTTVNCPNGAGTTGQTNPVMITKDANTGNAKPGDEITYTATVQNSSTSACIVNQFIDHLPNAFEFVSTTGAFGTVVQLDNRPGGGVDVVIKPANVTIAPNGSATQTFVVRVRDTAAPGVYFNNVELLCANLGNWVKGLDAPVAVSTDDGSPPPRRPQCSDGIDNDGDGKIDFPTDPGCDSTLDDDERDAPRRTLPRTGGTGRLYVVAGLLLLAAAVTARRSARA